MAELSSAIRSAGLGALVRAHRPTEASLHLRRSLGGVLETAAHAAETDTLASLFHFDQDEADNEDNADADLVPLTADSIAKMLGIPARQPPRLSLPAPQLAAGPYYPTPSQSHVNVCRRMPPSAAAAAAARTAAHTRPAPGSRRWAAWPSLGDGDPILGACAASRAPSCDDLGLLQAQPRPAAAAAAAAAAALGRDNSRRPSAAAAAASQPPRGFVQPPTTARAAATAPRLPGGLLLQGGQHPPPLAAAVATAYSHRVPGHPPTHRLGGNPGLTAAATAATAAVPTVMVSAVFPHAFTEQGGAAASSTAHATDEDLHHNHLGDRHAAGNHARPPPPMSAAAAEPLHSPVVSGGGGGGGGGGAAQRRQAAPYFAGGGTYVGAASGAAVTAGPKAYTSSAVAAAAGAAWGGHNGATHHAGVPPARLPRTAYHPSIPQQHYHYQQHQHPHHHPQLYPHHQQQQHQLAAGPEHHAPAAPHRPPAAPHTGGGVAPHAKPQHALAARAGGPASTHDGGGGGGGGPFAMSPGGRGHGASVPHAASDFWPRAPPESLNADTTIKLEATAIPEGCAGGGGGGGGPARNGGDAVAGDLTGAWTTGVRHGPVSALKQADAVFEMAQSLAQSGIKDAGGIASLKHGHALLAHGEEMMGDLLADACAGGIDGATTTVI
ncbi:hypothetical protein HK405_003955 [Cladochytrium tenue]|nr:hypothetical protein HK405_003955 [Cladochytrium tenue]